MLGAQRTTQRHVRGVRVAPEVHYASLLCTGLRHNDDLPLVILRPMSWCASRLVRRVRMHVAVISLGWHAPSSHLVRGVDKSGSKLK